MAGENCENIKQHPAPVQSVQAMGNLGGIDVGIDGKTAVAVSKPCLDRSSKGEQNEGLLQNVSFAAVLFCLPWQFSVVSKG